MEHHEDLLQQATGIETLEGIIKLSVWSVTANQMLASLIIVCLMTPTESWWKGFEIMSP